MTFTPNPQIQVGDNVINTIEVAVLSRNILTGQQPTGTYSNKKLDGSVYTYSGAVTTSALVTPWISTDGFTSIDIFIRSDQPSTTSGITIAYTNNVASPTIQATSRLEYTSNGVITGYNTYSILPILNGLRVSYVSSVGTSNFFMSITLRTNSNINSYSSGQVLLTEDFANSVMLGNISNYTYGVMFGRTLALATLNFPADVWEAGGATFTYPGQPQGTAAFTLTITSTSASDIGAVISVYGLRLSTSTAYTTSQFTLGAGAPGAIVNTGVSWFRIIKLNVVSVAAGSGNVGTISSFSTVTPTIIFGTIQPTINSSNMAVYTVPQGSFMLIKRIYVSFVRNTGAANYGTLKFVSRLPNGAVYNCINFYDIVTSYSVTNSGGYLIQPGSDVLMRGLTSVNNGTLINAGFEFFLISTP